MEIASAYLLNGKPVPCILRYALSVQNLTQEQLSERASDYEKLCKIAESIADFSNKLVLGEESVAKTTVEVIQDLASRGDTAACFTLGKKMLNGATYVPKDELRGLEYLKIAAMNGFERAQTLIGFYYKDAAKQPKMALPYLYAAAQQDSPRAQVLLADYLEHGVDGLLDADAFESLRLLRSATDGTSKDLYYKGMAAATLADKYADGLGVGQDVNESVRWNRQAVGWGYTDNRMNLVKQLKSIDAKGNEKEIESLLKAAKNDEDPRAQSFISEEEWNRNLDVWKYQSYSVDFWTRRMTYLGSDSHSNSSLYTVPGSNAVGQSVYTVSNHWHDLQFKDLDGNLIKLVPERGGKSMVINPGAEVIVLYAGPSKTEGNAVGFPYRIYKPGTAELGELRKLDTLTKQMGLSNGFKPLWLLLTLVGLAMVFIGGKVFFIGFAMAVLFGFLWNKVRAEVSNVSDALGAHFDSIGRWVNALR